MTEAASEVGYCAERTRCRALIESIKLLADLQACYLGFAPSFQATHSPEMWATVKTFLAAMEILDLAPADPRTLKKKGQDNARHS